MRRFVQGCLALSVLGSLFVPGVAFAEDDEDAHPAPAPAPVVVANPSAAARAESAAVEHPEGPARYDYIRVNTGLRMGYVPSPGFDTFSTNDVLPQFSIDGTYTLLTTGKLALAAGLGYDIGGRSAKSRGLDASLVAHRLYVPLEARLHVAKSVYTFVKIAPGAAAMMATVEDSGSPAKLKDTAWAFSADASLGASFLLGPRGGYDKKGVRFWATPEIGYSLTTNASLRPNPNRDEDDVLGTDVSTNLRSLALSGIFWRLTVGTTF